MDEQKLEKMYEMVEDNNRMLHAMRRSALIGGVIKFAFWVFFLLVLPYLTWLYIQPYIQEAQGVYQGAQSKATQADSTLTQLQKFFEQFGGSAGQ